MSKNVVAILPGDRTQIISVDDELKIADFIGENGGILSLPIEKFNFDEKEYFVCRYSHDISETFVKETIERLLK